MINSQHEQGISGWLNKCQLLNFWGLKLTLHCGGNHPPLPRAALANPTFHIQSKILQNELVSDPWHWCGAHLFPGKEANITQKPPRWFCHPTALQILLSTSLYKKGTGKTGSWYCCSLCHMVQGPSIFLSWMMKLFSQFNDATRDLDGGFAW